MVAVTGALSYSGRYITDRLLRQGHRVLALTNHPDRPNPFGDRISFAPLAFDRPEELARSLAGVTVLYNTYWIRFPWRGTSYRQALANTQTLLLTARAAGVSRVVHVSIANAAADSPVSYYRGKAEAERILASAGLSYSVLRPTVLFGGRDPAEDVLINNIAWMLRRFLFFAVPGNGSSLIQPLHVDDLAEMAVEAGGQSGNAVRDAAGPETYTFEELVRLIARSMGSRARILRSPPWLVLAGARFIGAFVRDVVLTRDELGGLMANLLVSTEEPAGRTRISEWLASHASILGVKYASELDRHYRREVDRNRRPVAVQARAPEP